RRGFRRRNDSDVYPDQVLHWIGDGEVASSSGDTLEKRCPIDDRMVARVARGTAADVERAVGAAAAAADTWRRIPPPRRGAVLGGRLLQDAGLPAGVYSAVQGLGDEVGARLTEDCRVGLVSFTGSVQTGKRIQQTVSGRRVLAKVCLELGGKNPLVVCDDAD